MVRTVVLDPVDDRPGALLEPQLQPPEDRLESSEPCVDAIPACLDQIDEQGEVVHARMAVRDGVVL